jgi:hypothetical protein
MYAYVYVCAFECMRMYMYVHLSVNRGMSVRRRVCDVCVVSVCQCE